MNPKLDQEVVWDHIAAAPGIGAAIRRSVREHLERWRLSPDAVEVAALVTSELVTNAVKHGRPPTSLAVRTHPTGVRIEVTDGGAGTPVPSYPEPPLSGGRGLWLVETLTARWGWFAGPAGKTVWAEVTGPTQRNH